MWKNNQDSPGDSPQGERLQKFLARAGIASRRHAETMIAAGHVSVNDEVVREQGVRIDPATDVVTVFGKQVDPPQTTMTIAIYKPCGYVSTAFDPQGRPTVIDLLPGYLKSWRFYPVGRLDLDSEGLLLLTNDGDLALRLTHPRYEKEKEYHVLISQRLTDSDLSTLAQGVEIPAFGRTAPAHIRRLPQGPAPVEIADQEWIAVTLHEGKKRQVRLMIESVGAKVVRLIRVRIGALRLEDIAIEEGKWRALSEDELRLVGGTQKVVNGARDRRKKENIHEHQ